MSDAAATLEAKCIPIKLFDSYAELQDENGLKKYISIPELLKSLQVMDTAEVQEVVRLLPQNAYAIVTSPGSVKIAMYFPEKVMTVKHLESEYTIPWPNTILVAHLQKADSAANWTKKIVKYFATSKTLGELNGMIPDGPARGDGIYRMPFPNFYDYDEMCFGGNTMPVAMNGEDFRPLKYYYDVIPLSPFNNDLGVRGFSDVSEPHELFEALDGLDTFPYDRFR